MKLCSLINEAISNEFELQTAGTIKADLRDIFASYSLPVQIDDISIDNGVISLGLVIDTEDEENYVELNFFVDADGKPFVAVLDSEEDQLEPDEEEYFFYPLNNIAPITKGADGVTDIVDMINPQWLTEQVFIDILTSEDESELGEAATYVIRNGKKVKKQLVRSKRRKILTPKQRAGIRKAVKSRRAKRSQISRKRKISNKLRKRMSLTRNTNKRLKVAGTSSRK